MALFCSPCACCYHDDNRGIGQKQFMSTCAARRRAILRWLSAWRALSISAASTLRAPCGRPITCASAPRKAPCRPNTGPGHGLEVVPVGLRLCSPDLWMHDTTAHCRVLRVEHLHSSAASRETAGSSGRRTLPALPRSSAASHPAGPRSAAGPAPRPSLHRHITQHISPMTSTEPWAHLAPKSAEQCKGPSCAGMCLHACVAQAHPRTAAGPRAGC